MAYYPNYYSYYFKASVKWFKSLHIPLYRQFSMEANRKKESQMEIKLIQYGVQHAQVSLLNYSCVRSTFSIFLY